MLLRVQLGVRWSALSFLIAGIACNVAFAGSQAPAPPPRVEVPPASAAPAPTDAPRTATAEAKPRDPNAWANVDPDDDDVVGPPDVVEGCEDLLKRSGVTFRRASLATREKRTKKATFTCGAPQVVTYIKGPTGVTYNPPAVVTCAMAAALASFERIAQDEATSSFRSKVVRIDHLGTYNCRPMKARPEWVSEHAYANAIDIARFVLANGRTIDVARDFDMGDDTPASPAGMFLRTVSRRANDEDVFSHVLTRFFDELHRDHFHLDLARYRTDGTRPRHRGS